MTRKTNALSERHLDLASNEGIACPSCWPSVNLAPAIMGAVIALFAARMVGGAP